MNKRLGVFLSLLVWLVAVTAVAQEAKVAAPQEPAKPTERVALSPAAREGGMALHEALARRQSVRDFVDKPISQRELGQLLWAAQGVNRPNGRRTAPSANALYPLELYVATADGFFHYEPREHQLERHSTGDLRPAIAKAARGQKHVPVSAAVFIFAGVFERMTKRYGEAQRQRGSNFVFIEAGHAAQNLLLEVVALNLGAVPMGGFDEGQLQEAVALPSDHRPIYMVAVGFPRTN